MKIAIAQINPINGDLQHNREKIIEQLALATQQEADIVLFGEMALTGKQLYDLPLAGNFAEEVWSELSEIAEYTNNIDMIIGVPIVVDDEVFSGAVHVSRGEIVQEFYRAMVTSRDELSYISGVESEQFEADEPLENIINVNGENLLVAIGDDISYIDSLELFTPASKPYIAAVVHLDATRYYHGVGYEKVTTQQSIAKEIKRPIISANLCGADMGTLYYGGSTAINDKGQLIMQMQNFEEGLAVVELEALDEYKPLPIAKLTPKGKSRETYDALTLTLRDYMTKRGFSKVALGLSGGIDSAVVLGIAINALGASNVEVLLMPSKFSSTHSVDDSVKMAEGCGVKYHILPINSSYDAALESLAPIFGDTPFGLAEENIQSRLRGVYLMAFSNKYGHIILNTSNKCEVAMGYGTLYGDTNGAISLLGDLYKGEIYDLARYINREGEVIPKNIIEKAPSAELRPDQKDSDSLPEYNVLDRILYQMIEEAKDAETIVKSGFDGDTVAKVERLLKLNEYKRRQLPPVVRLSKATLGIDRIMPI